MRCILDFPLNSPHSQRAFCSLIRIAIEHSNEYVDGEHRMDWIELLSRNIGKESTKKQMSQILHSADIEVKHNKFIHFYDQKNLDSFLRMGSDMFTPKKLPPSPSY